MGKKIIVFVEYDCDSGVVEPKFYNAPKRSDAIKILRKLQQYIGRTIYGGWESNELLEIIEDAPLDEELKKEEEVEDDNIESAGKSEFGRPDEVGDGGGCEPGDSGADGDAGAECSED